MKKTLYIIAALLVIALIGLTVFIKVYITPERVKAFLIPQAEKHLNRKVDIEELNISILKGITVKNFAIKEKDGKTDFLKSKEFVLKYKFLPLLSKLVIIDELKIVSPEIRIIRNKEGKFNFEDIGKKKPAKVQKEEEKAEETKGLPISLLVSKLVIDDAKFSLTDNMNELPDIKGAIDINTGIKSAGEDEIASEGSIDIRLDEAVIKKPSEKIIKNISAGLKYGVKVNLKLNSIDIYRGDIKIQKIPITITGGIKDFKTSPSIDLNISLTKTKADDLLDTINPFVNLKGLALSGELSVDLNIKGMPEHIDSLKTDFRVTLGKIGITYEDKTGMLDGDLKFNLTSNNIHIDKADIKARKISALISGDIKNFRTSPEIDIAVSLPKTNAADILDSVSPFVDTKGLSLVGDLAADLKVKGLPQKPDSLIASGNVLMENAKFNYGKINAVINGNFVIKSNDLYFKKAEVMAQKIRATIAGNIKNIMTEPVIDIALSIPKTETADILDSVSPFVDTKGMSLAGDLTADLKVKGLPKKPDSLVASGNILMEKVGINYDKINAVVDGDFTIKSNDLYFEKAKVMAQKVMATVKGNVKNIMTEPVIDIALSIPKTETADILDLVSPFVDTKGLALKGGLMAGLKIKGIPKKIDSLKTNGKVNLENFGISYEDISVLLDGELGFREQSMDFNLNSSVGKNTAKLKGSVDNYFKNQKVNLNLYSKKLILDELIPAPVEKTGGSSQTKKEKTVQKGNPSPKKEKAKKTKPVDINFSADGEIKIDTAIYNGMNMNNFYTKFQLKDKKLDISNMTALVGKGKFNLTSLIDFSKPDYTYSLSSSLDSLPSEEIVNALFPKAKNTIFGILSSNLRLNGKGNSVENIKKSLIGNGDFNIKNGIITNSKIPERLADFLGIEELRTINLKQANGSVKIGEGVASLDSILSSDDLSMNPSGNIGLVDETLDLAFDLKLSSRLTDKVTLKSDVASYIKDEEGWGIIPLKISGTFSDPSYSIDIKRAGKRVIKKKAIELIDDLLDKDQKEDQQKEQGKDKKDELKKSLEKVLEDLF